MEEERFSSDNSSTSYLTVLLEKLDSLELEYRKSPQILNLIKSINVLLSTVTSSDINSLEMEPINNAFNEAETKSALQEYLFLLEKLVLETSLTVKRKTVFDESNVVIGAKICIIVLSFLLFPMKTLFEPVFLKMEMIFFTSFNFAESIKSNFVFTLFDSLISRSKGPIKFAAFFNSYIFLTVHPFISYEITVVSQTVYFVSTILKLFFKDQRPQWLAHEDGLACLNSFDNPSFLIVFITFHIPAYMVVYNRSNQNTSSNKIAAAIIFFLLIAYTLFIIGNKGMFFFQMAFSFCFSLFTLFIFSEFEKKIRKVFNTILKDVYSMRKYLLKLFIFSIVVFIFAFFVYSFSLDEIVESKLFFIIIKSDMCKKIKYVGSRATFKEVVEFCTILVVHAGFTFNVEKDTKQWWGLTTGNKSLKTLVLFIFFIFIVFLQSI